MTSENGNDKENEDPAKKLLEEIKKYYEGISKREDEGVGSD